MGAGLKATIVGPPKDQLEALQAEWDKFVKKNGRDAQGPCRSDRGLRRQVRAQSLQRRRARRADGKRILLTGDARGDYVLEGLKAAGVLDGTLHLDVLKVPHHGSNRDVEVDFFERSPPTTT